MNTAYCLLANQFEETEAIAVIDILRRGGVNIQMVSMESNLAITGSHGICVQADIPWMDLSVDEMSFLFIPGGPAVKKLVHDERIKSLIQTIYKQKKIIAAICAAPRLLVEAEVHKGHKITGHSSIHSLLPDDIKDVNSKVLWSEPLLTSQGVGTAIPFALELLNQLGMKEKSIEISKAIMYA